MSETPNHKEEIDLQLRRVGVILGWMLVVAGACYTIYLVRNLISGVFDVLTPFLGAAVLAYILDPIVTNLQRRFRLSRVWGLLVCYALVLGVSGAFFVTLVPILKKQSVAASSAIARAIPAAVHKVLGISLLDQSDLEDPAPIVERLRRAQDPPSAYLRQKFPHNLQALVDSYDGVTTPSEKLVQTLTDELNRLLTGDRFRERPAFSGVKLSPQTQELFDQGLAVTDPIRANRLLLESAYPNGISPSQPLNFTRRFMTDEFRDQLLEWASQKEFAIDDLKGVLPATHKLLDVVYGQFHTLAAGILGSVNSAISLFTAALFVVIISFYFIIDFDKFGYFLRVVLPDQHEERVFAILKKMDRAVGGFLRGQLTVCFCVGTMTTVGLLLLGFHTPTLAKYCLLIGIVAGVANFIPYLGPILGAAPAVLIVLFVPAAPGEAIAWGYRFWGLGGIALMMAIIQLTEGFVLQPYVVGVNSELHPLVVMLALIAGAQFGLGGMIVAVPVAAMTRVVIKELWWDKLAEAQQAADRRNKKGRGWGRAKNRQ